MRLRILFGLALFMGTGPVPGACGAEPSRRVLLKVPFFPDTTDQCGPSTLAGILAFWGKPSDPATLRQEIYQDKLKGTLPMDLVLTAEAHGLKTQMIRGDLAAVKAELRAGHPVAAMLNTGFLAVPVDHYVILTGFDEERQGVLMHSAGKENQFMIYKKFLNQWDKTDNWAMLAGTP